MSVTRSYKNIVQTNKTKEKIIVILRGMKKAPSFGEKKLFPKNIVHGYLY